MNIILLFTVLQLINVVLSTIKSIVTVKGTTFQSALMNTVYYSLYTIIVIYTVSDFGCGSWDLPIKIAIVGVTDFVGVYISAFIMNKLRKDRLWEIVATVDMSESIYAPNLIEENLKDHKISYNIMETKKANEYVFHIYSKSQKESQTIKTILNEWKVKYFVHEESVKL